MNLKKGFINSFILENDLPGLNSGIIAREANIISYSDSLAETRNSEKVLMKTATGIRKKNIIFLNQVHGDAVIDMTAPPESDDNYAADADAMITAERRLCLVIRTADCVPVFFYDPENEVIAAAHSGWKGTQLDISGRVIDMMREVYGSNPENLLSWIYPSIGPQSYEVNEDVASFFPEERIESAGSIYVDLWSSIEKSLRKHGVPEKNIYNPRICNRQNTDDFFSHRYGDNGRNLNYAFLE